MTPQPKGVVLALTIQERRAGGFDFYVMQTPKDLWDALPQKAEFIEADYTRRAHYFKRFTLHLAGKSYEFTFYRTEARP